CPLAGVAPGGSPAFGGPPRGRLCHRYRPPPPSECSPTGASSADASGGIPSTIVYLSQSAHPGCCKTLSTTTTKRTDEVIVRANDAPDTLDVVQGKRTIGCPSNRKANGPKNSVALGPPPPVRRPTLAVVVVKRLVRRGRQPTPWSSSQ